jgi:hypothetical protein
MSLRVGRLPCALSLGGLLLPVAALAAPRGSQHESGGVPTWLLAAAAVAVILAMVGTLAVRAKKTGTPSRGPQTAWQSEIGAAKGGLEGPIFWDYRNGNARALICAMLARVPGVDGAQVEESEDKQRIDLSGTVGSTRFRAVVVIGEYAASIGNVELSSDGRFDRLCVERDIEKIPKRSAPNDRFENDEPKRVFLGKGIFVAGKNDVESKTATWARLPKEAQDAVLAEMTRLNLSRLYLGRENISVTVRTLLDDMADPVSVITSCTQLLELVHRTSPPRDVGGTPDPAKVPVAPPPLATFACPRCRSVFATTGPDRSACPNCGAA